MLRVEVMLFGCFKGRAEGEAVMAVELPAAATVGELRASLAARLAGPVAESAIANEAQVLLDHHPIGRSCRLALLPPVSGG